jgi:hypothetical protein
LKTHGDADAMNDLPIGDAADAWPDAAVHRIPFSTYTRSDLYERELARFF